MTPIIDAHLDLAWNALSYDRDLTQDVADIRRAEAGLTESGRGQATVSLPAMRRAEIAVCFATLLARARPQAALAKEQPRTSIDHINQDAAYAIAQGQLAYYQRMETRGLVKIIHNSAQLDAHWSSWSDEAANPDPPIGVVLSMEGADPIAHPDQAQHWHRCGLRALSLAHYGPSAYANGTPSTPAQETASLTPRGRELLKQLAPLNVMLDLTHASDASFHEAADAYPGPVFASHSNCRKLVPGTRQLTDEQIKRIIDRCGVIGCVLEASMLHPGWRTGQTPRDTVPLTLVADHIDHICQLAGTTDHAAIGSDLDGGFGAERCPREIDSITDLTALAPILTSRGYTDKDTAAIFHGNWLKFLHRSLTLGG